MAAGGRAWRTTPNVITLARAGAVPVVLILLAFPNDVTRYAAAALFFVASLGDAFDGYLARREGSASPLGMALDLTADKLLVGAVLIALTGLQHAPAWTVIVIVARELIVSGVRTYAAGEGVALPAQWGGKFKTFLTTVAVIVAILQLPGASWLLGAAAIMTVISAWPYVSAGVRLARNS